MNKNKANIFFLVMSSLFLNAGLYSCKKGGGIGKGDAIYLTGAEVGNLTVFYASRVSNSYAISASATNKAERDEEVVFTPRPELVENFNHSYKASFVALPQDKYQLSKTTGIIKKGEMISESIKINITDPEIAEKGPVYMLPVTIQKKGSDGYPVLEGSKTLYIAVAKGTEGSIIEINGGRISPLKFLDIVSPKLKKLESATLEGRVKINNMDGFLPTLFGTEESFILRIASSSGGSGYFPFQLAGGKAVTSKLSASTGVWYHVAAVWDKASSSKKLYVNGRLQNFASFNSGSTVDLSFDSWLGFHIGAYSADGGRPISAQFAEVRIWSTARTPLELATSACVVDPSTTGLEAYWRLNESKGDTCYDATGHGHTAKLYGSYKWINGVKCGD